MSLQLNSELALILAWAFVLFRCVHAYIHLGYNHIIHRLSAFWLALICVLALWINLLVLHA